MTLGQFIEHMGNNAFYPLFYFFILPVAALLANFMAKGEGHLSPWCIFYSVLIYLSVIPGIFSILLNLYHMFFEKRSIYDMNMMVDVLPVISMVLTLFLIKKNVDFKEIPGFGKLTGFVGSIAGLMLVFFVLEKMHLIVFSYLPIQWLVIALVVAFIAIRLFTKKAFT